MPTTLYRITLPDDLAAFVAEAVRDGLFESPDDLFAHAVALVRTQTALGYSPDAPTAPPPQSSEVVDLTREGFDGPAFMATLVDKLERRKADVKKPR